MPLQIKELYIKVAVDSGGAQAGSIGSDANGAVSKEAQSLDRGQIIAECVEQVMEILKEKMEP